MGEGLRSPRPPTTTVKDQPTICLANGTVVFANETRRADLVLAGEEILGIDSERAQQVIDCSGCYVLPGFVDPHTDNLERHAEPRPGIFWPIEQALISHDSELAAAGITTAFNALTVGTLYGINARGNLAVQYVSAIRNLQRSSLMRVDHRLHLRCELSDDALTTHLDALRDTSPEIVSLMNHTPGRRQWRNIERFRNHYMKRYGLHEAEIEAIIRQRQDQEALVVPANKSCASNLARSANATLASHDDTEAADVLEAVELGCTFAEFPTTLGAAMLATKHGLSVIAGAPNLVRGGSHSGNVSVSDFVNAQCFDVLSSDYWPPSLLQAVFRLHDTFGFALAAAVKSATLTPARRLGLHDRGEIARGLRADILVVKPTAFGPVVRETWVKGTRVF